MSSTCGRLRRAPGAAPMPRLWVVARPGPSTSDDAVGAVTCQLGASDVRAEHERDVLAAELAGELSAFREQLERRRGRLPSDGSTKSSSRSSSATAARRGVRACPSSSAPARVRGERLIRRTAVLEARYGRRRGRASRRARRAPASASPSGRSACRSRARRRRGRRGPDVDAAVRLARRRRAVRERDDGRLGELPGLVAVVVSRVARRTPSRLVSTTLVRCAASRGTPPSPAAPATSPSRSSCGRTTTRSTSPPSGSRARACATCRACPRTAKTRSER
jgi:hypothetical protein